ncbi:hypothetical protein V502_01510 [Pseudogymnoascus sp. VKM F-4520 (FW-2644)]|nr:hypothetical protein V502_01510 [Pseudogymnoascus sp. VKM F-4520 (FW-2644)]
MALVTRQSQGLKSNSPSSAVSQYKDVSQTIGLQILQNSLLQILANGPPNIVFDGSEIPPSLNEAASIPRESKPQVSQAADAELDLFQAGPPLTPIATLPNILPTNPQRYRTEFSADVTEQNEEQISAIRATPVRNLRNDESRNAIEFLTNYIRKVLGALSAAPEDPLSAPAYQTLGSLGIVNNHLQSKHDGKAETVEVDNWWLSVEIINHVLGTMLWTWDGRLNLVVSYNGAFYERSFVEQFIDGWGRELTRALGVE